MEMPDGVLEHVCGVTQMAATTATMQLIQSGAGICFANLNDTETGELTGLVVVTLDAEHAQAMIDYIKSMDGYSERPVVDA